MIETTVRPILSLIQYTLGKHERARCRLSSCHAVTHHAAFSGYLLSDPQRAARLQQTDALETPGKQCSDQSVIFVSNRSPVVHQPSN